MRGIILDNSTLTATQRLLGEIQIKDKQLVDGDILAFENLVQAILFYDEVFYVNDYKPEYASKRQERFKSFGQIDLPTEIYDSLVAKTREICSEMIPVVRGGQFKDENFKPFFELLKMHNIFTWDMCSSEFYLTQKMLTGDESEIEKYSKLNAMIFSELQDNSLDKEMITPKPLLYGSKGEIILSENKIIDKEGVLRNAYSAGIGNRVDKFFANLGWLAFRTVFYTLVAREAEMHLALHPIRNSFQINFLSRFNPEIVNLRSDLISAMNGPVEQTLKAIHNNIAPITIKNPLPIFSAFLVSKTKDPLHIIDAAYHLKLEPEFILARKQLEELELLRDINENQKFLKEANKLVLEIQGTMQRILTKFNITTPQGISIAPVIFAYNLAALNNPGIPKIPNMRIKVKFLDGIRDLMPQKGFGGVYKSVINDLTSISKLGQYHELLTSKVVCSRYTTNYHIKTESPVFVGKKADWKIPM